MLKKINLEGMFDTKFCLWFIKQLYENILTIDLTTIKF